MKIVSVLNHKGGVGKTTFCGGIGQALALVGFRVLVIDNDSQHNLSAMMGTGSCSPNIRDVYLAPAGQRLETLLRSIRTTAIERLHIVTSCRELSDADIREERLLAETLRSGKLDAHYDYILIDNAPGLARLQESAIHAADEIFTPIELRQFAVDGVVEMAEILANRFGKSKGITRIIPNFYKPTKRQKSFYAALRRLFGDAVTTTAIAVDNVFDELITENKVLFLHRLSSKAAAYYLKLMHELFNLDEEEVWDRVQQQRNEAVSREARERYYQNRESREKDV